MLIKSLLKFPSEVLIISVISVVKIPLEISKKCYKTTNNPDDWNQEPAWSSFNKKSSPRWMTFACELQSVALTMWSRPTWKIPDLPFWICVINRKFNTQGMTPKLERKQKGWTHFPVNSQDLQRVSYFRYHFFAGLMSSASFICLILVERNKNTF